MHLYLCASSVILSELVFFVASRFCLRTSRVMGVGYSSADIVDDGPESVSALDLTRFGGRWFEVARTLNWFEGPDSIDITLTYDLRAEPSLLISESLFGSELTHKFTLTTPEPSKFPGRFVLFRPRGKHDPSPRTLRHWVLEVVGPDNTDDPYQYAVVGEPRRASAWILARDKCITDSVYAELQSRLRTIHGYDVSELRRTLHDVGDVAPAPLAEPTHHMYGPHGHVPPPVGLFDVGTHALESLLFWPKRRYVTTPSDAYGVHYENVEIDSASGVDKLRGWWIPGDPDNNIAVLWLHGIGGNVSTNIDLFFPFRDAGAAVLAIDYRGFGHSDGAPSEQGVYEDSISMLDELLSRIRGSHRHVVFVGHSMGTAAALNLASRRPPSAVVVIGTFTTIRSAVESIFGDIGVDSIGPNMFDNLSRVTHINIPAVVIHGRHDRLVPWGQGKLVFETMATDPGRKKFVTFEDSGHSDMASREPEKYVRAIRDGMAMAADEAVDLSGMGACTRCEMELYVDGEAADQARTAHSTDCEWYREHFPMLGDAEPVIPASTRQVIIEGKERLAVFVLEVKSHRGGSIGPIKFLGRRDPTIERLDLAPDIAGSIVELNLFHTNLKTVENIAMLPVLRVLNISRTRVDDFAPLSAATRLQSLEMNGNTGLDDIYFVSTLTDLRDLGIACTAVSNVTPLVYLTRLTRLDVAMTKVESVYQVTSLPWLLQLDVDVAPVAGSVDILRQLMPNTAVYGNPHIDDTPSTTRPSTAQQSPSPTTLGHRDVLDGKAYDMVPTAGAAAPGDPGALYISDQRGYIRRLDLATRTLSDSTLIDVNRAYRALDAIPEQIASRFADERGLVGFAFHPDYDVRSDPFYRALFIAYTIPPSAELLERLHHAEDSTVENILCLSYVRVDDADLQSTMASEIVLARIAQPEFNHNGAPMFFGPLDGLLYMLVGDGGGAGDRHGRRVGEGRESAFLGNAQDTSVLLGKILRFSVIVSDGGRVGIEPAPGNMIRDEALTLIFAVGVRNAIGMTARKSDGAIIVGQVGQQKEESVYVIPSDMSGANLGWRAMEGSLVYNRTVLEYVKARGDVIMSPVMTYGHDVGRAVIGGIIYEGDKVPYLNGAYIFGDYNGSVFVGTPDDDGNWTMETLYRFPDIDIHNFARDASGEVYVLGRTPPYSVTNQPTSVLPSHLPIERPTLVVYRISTMFDPSSSRNEKRGGVSEVSSGSDQDVGLLDGAAHITADDARKIFDRAVAIASVTESKARDARPGTDNRPTAKFAFAIAHRKGGDAVAYSEHHMDDVWPTSITIARAKAVTGSGLSSSENATTTEALGRAMAGGSLRDIICTVGSGKAAAFAGGAPLYKRGVIVGGIGVSGDTEEVDARVMTAIVESFRSLSTSPFG